MIFSTKHLTAVMGCTGHDHRRHHRPVSPCRRRANRGAVCGVDGDAMRNNTDRLIDGAFLLAGALFIAMLALVIVSVVR